MTDLIKYTYESDIGPIYLVQDNKGLVMSHWEEPGFHIPMAYSLGRYRILSQAVSELNGYFSGRRTEFTVPLSFDRINSKFKLDVLSSISKIKYNETSTYSEIATAIGNEKSARAVGNAANKNPLCIFIPCHRVITSSGRSGGFSGGCEIKKKLLGLERDTEIQNTINILLNA